MTICEAVKSRTAERPYITRKAWIHGLPIKIYPTDTPDNCAVVSLQDKVARRGWQPTTEDLIAEDWIISDFY